MNHGDSIERLLRELTAPRRNNYFYGKLLDVCHFEMEQTYVNRKRWLLNRLALGSGVLCGLAVTADGGEICVEPGVAIDGYGREIIVPVRTCIDPWQIVDPCGEVTGQRSKEEACWVTLLLCYRECLTDHQPVLVSDCDTEEETAAGTVVETFRLVVEAGKPTIPPAVLDPRCCASLFLTEDEPDPGETTDEERASEALAGLARRRRQLCECAAEPCPTPEEPCVVLAAIHLDRGGTIGKIEECRYQQRVYSNQVLLELILCLAARLDECCEEDGEPAEAPRVASVELIDPQGRIRGRVTDPSELLTIPPDVAIGSLRFRFTADMDPTTLVAGGPDADPQKLSVVVSEAAAGHVGGELVMESADRYRWKASAEVLSPGEYALRLFGDADANTGRPAITGADGQALDGEPLALPSGDGTPGGVFVTRFRIEKKDEEEKPVPPKVAGVEFLDYREKRLGELTDPAKTPTFNVERQLRFIRVRFTADVDPDTVVAGAAGDSPDKQSFLVTEAQAGLYPGKVTMESGDTARWQVDLEHLHVGSFTVQLFGDSDAAAGRPAITGVDGLRLDGEPLALPSGDGTEGGVFKFHIEITD